MKRKSHKRIEVNLEELDRIIDHGMDVPLSKAEGQKIKAALHAMAERLTGKRSTEKTAAFCRSRLFQRLRRSKLRMSPLRLATGATAPLHSPGLTELPFSTPQCIPAIRVRNAAKGKSTVRKSPPHWCALWGKRP